MTANAYRRLDATYDINAWATPQWLFDELNAKFHFDLDVCADDYNHKCELYFSKEQNGLLQAWRGYRCWNNPPYDEVDQWLAKAWLEASENGVFSCNLVKADTSTAWFHRWYKVVEDRPEIARIRFLKRIQFVPPPGYVPPINPKTGKPKGSGSPNMGHCLFLFNS